MKFSAALKAFGYCAISLAAYAADAPAPQQQTYVKKNSDQCITHEGAIEDMRKRRDEIELRAKELSARESELTAREKALEDELKKIQLVRDDIAKIEEVARKQNEEKVSKIVETIEAMSPKSAAKMIAELDERLAVSTIERLSTPRLAKIMNLMEPETSSRLNEIMAGVARARGVAIRGPKTASLGAAAAQKKNGGEKDERTNDTSVKQQQPVDGDSAAAGGNSARP